MDDIGVPSFPPLTTILLSHKRHLYPLDVSSPVPGWELPMSWTKPDTEHNGGPRHFGRLKVTYTSDATKGCTPKWKLREALMQHVLASTS